MTDVTASIPDVTGCEARRIGGLGLGGERHRGATARRPQAGGVATGRSWALPPQGG
jgi:hypothetical protein